MHVAVPTHRASVALSYQDDSDTLRISFGGYLGAPSTLRGKPEGPPKD